MVISVSITLTNIFLTTYSIKIGRLLKDQTGKEPHQRLILLHIVNMIVMSVSSFVQTYMMVKDK